MLVSGLVVSGQDVIVRITGDSLHVRIQSSNDSFVYYQSAQSHRGEVEVISRKEIAEILYNFEDAGNQLLKVTNREKRDYELIELWFAYGVSFMPNSEIPDGDFKEYYEKLQWGRGFSLGGSYFFNQKIGINAVFSTSTFENSVAVSLSSAGIGGTVAYGNLSDDINLKYIGGGLTLRYELVQDVSHFELQVGAGLNYYSNQAELVYGFDLNANGVGFHVNTIGNLSMGGGLYVLVCLSYQGGFVDDISFKPNAAMPQELNRELDGLYSDAEKSTVNRFSLRAGLSFAF
jgi:hypothetical protein